MSKKWRKRSRSSSASGTISDKL